MGRLEPNREHARRTCILCWRSQVSYDVLFGSVTHNGGFTHDEQTRLERLETLFVS